MRILSLRSGQQLAVDLLVLADDAVPRKPFLNKTLRVSRHLQGVLRIR
jgi:hypothetical protein